MSCACKKEGAWLWDATVRTGDDEVTPRGGGGRLLAFVRDPPPSRSGPKAPGGGGGVGGGVQGGAIGGGGSQGVRGATWAREKMFGRLRRHHMYGR